MSHLLLVDDDIELTQMLGEYLEQEGFTVTLVHHGEAAIQALNAHSFALIVLDVMMPGLSGIEVLSRIRLTSQIPVLMLTARGDDIDRIIGLELGADDYIAKPCNPRELLARINAVIKRTTAQSSDFTPLTHERLELDQVHRICKVDGENLKVTGTEFDLLVALLQQQGNVASKEWLSQTVLQRELQPLDRSLDVHVSRLRKKLQPFHEDPIKAVRGKGYQLVL